MNNIQNGHVDFQSTMTIGICLLGGVVACPLKLIAYGRFVSLYLGICSVVPRAAPRQLQLWNIHTTRSHTHIPQFACRVLSSFLPT